MASGTIGGITDQNVFKVNVLYTANGQHCQTGFKVRDVAVNDNTCETVANSADAWVTGNFRALLLPIDFILATDVVRLHSEEGFRIEHTAMAGTNAPGDTHYAPTFLSAMVSLKTQRRKRYGQGRMFWPVRDDVMFDRDTLTAGGLANLQGVLDALLALYTGSDLTHDLKLVNAHEIIPPRAATTGSPARLEIPATWYDVEASKLSTALTSLRSRKVGIGA